MKMLSAILLLAFVTTGCTTRSTARLKQQNAFLTGQNAALQQQALAVAQAQGVAIVGAVQNPAVPWVEGLTLAQAIGLDDLKTLAGRPEEIERRLPHPRTLLPEMPSVTVDEHAAGRLRNGMQVNLPEFSDASLVKVFTTPVELLGIAKRIAGTLMQPIVVLG